MPTFQRSYHVKRAIITAALTAVSLIALSSAAAAGPPLEPFEENDATWNCDIGAPDFHCMNVRSKGHVGLIMVFPPDDRGPAESWSTDDRFDSRPCPHDPDGDGTWYRAPSGVWVCHHKP